jgi:AcrR family transcriptional regulator
MAPGRLRQGSDVADQTGPGRDSDVTGQRRHRADARENYGRLVETAGRAFARDGSQVTLKTIAAEAGVGIGTLYRHFPTREALVEEVYRTETRRLCDAADELLREVAALRAWTARFLDFMAAKDGMADVLQVVLSGDDELRTDTRARLAGAVATLLRAGQASGELRADLDPGDVFLALGGFALVLDRQPGAQALAGRLLGLLVDGLAAPGQVRPTGTASGRGRRARSAPPGPPAAR